VLPENPLTRERVKLKDFLLGIKGVGTYTKNTQVLMLLIYKECIKYVFSCIFFYFIYIFLFSACVRCSCTLGR
jgi:hypothetical protein